MSDTIFANGFKFYKRRENAPEFIKGSISIKADDAVEFIKKYKDEKGWINLDLKQAKSGTLYLSLNTYHLKKEADPGRDDAGYIASQENKDVEF